ncbi:TonB family protein [Altererythrobacter sp. JGD-16]|uniref:TonB family protein n=1 Tax=Altererythrobacter lutimaris TaxID=2743979 RepID=A0A850H8H4_9SPHN|nr:TonB family protein [Altererythrobacter lutimaris]
MVKRKGAVLLEPISPWNIDFGENRCRLTRLFGTADDQHLIMLEQAAPMERFGMTLAGSKVKLFAPGRWNYLGLRNDVPLKYLTGVKRGSIDGFGPALILGNVYIGGADPAADDDEQSSLEIDLEGAAKVDRVVLRMGTNILSFETGNMAPAVQALNVCAKDLLRAWGLDPEKHANYTPPDFLNLESIAQSIQRDYPKQALYRGQGGIFRVRLIVEQDGAVSDCHIEESTVSEALQTPACEKMKYAKFAPALDSDGNPMRSFYATTVTYATN